MALAVGDRAYVAATSAVDGNFLGFSPQGGWTQQAHFALVLVESQLASLGLNRYIILSLSLSLSFSLSLNTTP